MFTRSLKARLRNSGAWAGGCSTRACPILVSPADSSSDHFPTNLVSSQEGYLMGHRGGAERSRQGLGGWMGLGGEPGMNLSDLLGPQLPLAEAAAPRGQMSRPGKRPQGPAKERERNRLGTPTPIHPALPFYRFNLCPGSWVPFLFQDLWL